MRRGLAALLGAALVTTTLFATAPEVAATAPADDFSPASPQGDGSESSPIAFNITVDCAPGRTDDTVIVIEGDATVDDWYQLTVTLEDEDRKDCFSQHERAQSGAQSALCSEGSSGCAVTEIKTGFGAFDGDPWSHQVKFQFKLSDMWEPGDSDPIGSIRVIFGAPGNETGSVSFVIKKTLGTPQNPGSGDGTGPTLEFGVYHVSTTPQEGDGSPTDPFVFEVTIDCSRMPYIATGEQWNDFIAIREAEEGKHYALRYKVIDSLADNPAQAANPEGVYCQSGFGTVDVDPAPALSFPSDDFFLGATPTAPKVATSPAMLLSQGSSLRLNVDWRFFENLPGTPPTGGQRAQTANRSAAFSLEPKQSSGPGVNPCTATVPPFLDSYAQPELWAPDCQEEWLAAVDGTLTFPSSRSAAFLEHRLQLPSGTTAVRITTSGTMRSGPLGDTGPCGFLAPIPQTGPFPTTAPVTGPEGLSTCEITIDSGALTQDGPYRISGMVLIPDAGSFTLTYTVLAGTTEVESFAYTIVRGGTQLPGAEATVAAAAELAAEAEVEGTSSVVMVRGSEQVEVASSIVSTLGTRGGVLIEAEGVAISLSSALGATPSSGVLVAPDGEIECSLCAALVPGTKVEAWINSSPRLAVEVDVPAGHGEDDCLDLGISMTEPADGEGPIAEGAHTLELRMDTADGYTVVATGITVGSLAPASVPAGDGPVPASLLLLVAGIAGAVLVARRLAVVG